MKLLDRKGSMVARGNGMSHRFILKRSVSADAAETYLYKRNERKVLSDLLVRIGYIPTTFEKLNS